ncbi:MAG: uL13 family ribosomal protein, partial [Patescibacteria group bacterium]
MTTFVTTAKTIKRDWHLVDAKAQVLGRIATKIATLLQGKNKVYYTPQL